MSKKILSSFELFEELKKIINMPEDEIVSLELKLEVDKFPTMTIVRFVNIHDNLNYAEKEIKKFKLVPLGEDDA